MVSLVVPKLFVIVASKNIGMNMCIGYMANNFEVHLYRTHLSSIIEWGRRGMKKFGKKG